VIVHGDVEVVVTDLSWLSVPGLGGSPEHPMAPARRHAPELLHVQVEELPRAFQAVADGDAGGSIGVSEPVHPVTKKNPVHGGARTAQGGSEVVRSSLGPPALPQDPPLLPAMQGMRRAVGPARAIPEAGFSLLAEPGDPLVGGGAGHPDRLRRLRWCPPEHQHPIDQQPAAERSQLGPRMSHESLLSVRTAFSALNRARRLSSVNNLRGNYI